jgi:DNA polymerase-3 subunit gamma/tau
MGKALYRKYRSMSLDEIVGQEHITTTLKNAIKSGAISHAYLFTGPRGVGKTSVARILAHELNGLEYTGEDTNLDIIEIDAASNRGIDEIRDLREKVHIAPARSKYKVYIIDEVHMLTTPAFNALLKTLEEPPAHVIFILATTEIQKLPETIISRTQRHTFRPAEQSKVIEHLTYIAKQEKIKFDKDAMALIAAHGEGSFRDSISLLDQAASAGGTVTAEVVREVLGMPQDEVLQQILQSVVDGDKSTVVRQLDALQQQGFQAAIIAKQLSALVRASLLGETDASGLSDDTALSLLADLL